MQQLEIKNKTNVKQALRNVIKISKTRNKLKNEKIKKKLLSKAKKPLKKD